MAAPDHEKYVVLALDESEHSEYAFDCEYSEKKVLHFVLCVEFLLFLLYWLL